MKETFIVELINLLIPIRFFLMIKTEITFPVTSIFCIVIFTL